LCCQHAAKITCSHPRTRDATAEKILEKNHEKFRQLNFWQQNHRLHQNLSPSEATTAPWRRDNSEKNHIIENKKPLV